MKDEFKNIGLPKWPQLMIVGDDVTVDQAKDIIFRTDDFLTDGSCYAGGNEREFNKNYRQDCGFPDDKDFEAMKLSFRVREKIGFVNLNFVVSQWASTCFVGGPHGFCSPKGKIFFQDNVGKYPSVEEVYEDFVKIAEAWPFLNFKASLYSGESCESDAVCLVSFVVSNGKVEVTKEDFDLKRFADKIDFDEMLANCRLELGLPFHWYVDFSENVRKVISGLDWETQDEY